MKTGVEDFVGGRVLAWIGGVAVLVGTAFFFALAISHGWIGPAARTLIAGAGSLALLGGGIWLHGRRGRTDAALAAASTGVAGLFATLTVASHVYHLVPAPAGLALAALVGAFATALAVRWRAQLVAALGICGCLLAPVLAGAPSDIGSMAFLLVAAAAASGVLLWQRWSWLGFCAWFLSTVQWGAWLFEEQRTVPVLLVLAGFGALGVVNAIGFDLRKPGERMRPASAFLLALNALVLATAGWFWLAGEGHRTAGQLWLVGLALLHLAVGLAERRVERISHELGLLALGLGVAVADVAYGLIVSGPALAVGWAAGAVAFAVVRQRSRSDRGGEMLGQLGLGAHVGLALVRTLAADAQPGAVTGGGHGTLAAAIALSALAAACFSSARLSEDGPGEWRIALDSLGLAALAYLTAIALDGALLAIALAAESVALAHIARRTHDRVASIGALAFLSAAATHVLVLEAPPRALVYGVPHLAASAGALLFLAGAALRIGQLAEPGGWRRPALLGAGGLLLLHAASLGVVSAFQPGTPGYELSIFDIGARQQGQVLLSILWSITGLAAMVAGLRRDVRPVRLAGLALLLTTVAKVFFYDLAALTSVYRVASLVGLGLLLLVAAFSWQRLRPRPLPDLRAMPRALR